MSEFKIPCNDLVATLQARYAGWEGVDQFEGTAERLVRLYEELCWPMERILEEANKQFRQFKDGFGDMLVEGPISSNIICPHHLLPVKIKCWIGYIPQGKVLGVSKFARVTLIMGKRPIMQERYITELADLLMKNLEPKGVAVYMEGEHGCMSCRGVLQNAKVATSAVRGVFLTVPSARAEFDFIVARLQ